MREALRAPGWRAAVAAAWVLWAAAGCGPVPGEGRKVSVARGQDGYRLLVDGRDFYVQGAGVGEAFGRGGENYLELARKMGANAVRTWGTDQGNRRYLDEAARQGLLVDAGIWLNYVDLERGVSYLSDNEYLRAKEKEALDYVRRYRRHPAILMWNVGNEAVYFTKSEEERAALCRFLESLVRRIKQIDPDHPVIYASAGTTALPYLKEHVPSLDLVGMNVYGTVIQAHGQWETLGFGIPYLLTEFGPNGPWAMPRDSNGRVVEPSDYSKASQYRLLWRSILDRRGSNVGGFVFHLGETTQESLTYWNVNDRDRPRESWLEMRKQYTGLPVDDHAPRIFSFTGAPEKIRAGETFSVTLSAQDPEGRPLTFSYRASTAVEGVLKYYANEETALEVLGEGPSVTLRAPAEPGLYRIYGDVRDPAGHVSSSSRTIRVEPAIPA